MNTIINNSIETNEQAFRFIFKSEDCMNICIDALKHLAVIDEQGIYCLSPRKNSPLFAVIDKVTMENKELLKRVFSQRELIYYFSKFLKIEKLSRLSRDGADFLEYQKEAIAFIDKRIKELKIPPKT